MNIPLHRKHSPRFVGVCGKLLHALSCVVIAAGLLGVSSTVADAGRHHQYSEKNLRGTWVWSGLMKFGAPIPIPGSLVDGAPPHDMVAPGDVVGIWASLVGLMTFDGAGNVKHAEDVVKAGEIAPQPGLPFEHLPPFPEIYTGHYTVSKNGTVDIFLTGRDPSSPEGKVDFEFDLRCVFNRWPKEMTCVAARFKTFLVDPNGFAAPITGIINFKRQY